MKTIYKNGAVYTGKLPLVEAFAVEDGNLFSPEAAQRQMPLQQPATKL